MKTLQLVAIGVGAYGLHRYLTGTPLTPQQLAYRWITTLKNATPDHMVQLYSKDGILIPTFGEIKQGRSAIKGYFERFMGYENLEGSYDTMMVQSYISPRVNGCVVSGTYTFTFYKDGSDEPMLHVRKGVGRTLETVKARYSFVFNSDGLIMNHHSSEVPQLTSTMDEVDHEILFREDSY